MDSKYLIFTDGGSRGNPGPSGAGGIIFDGDHQIVSEISKFLGHQTNNYAEYQALKLTLEKAIELGLNEYEIEAFLDSKLVVEQVKGNWTVNSKNILPVYHEIKQLLLQFKNITFTHILRKYNKQADQLANMAMDHPN